MTRLTDFRFFPPGAGARRALSSALLTLLVPLSPALPRLYGDLDISGAPDAPDLVRYVNHFSGTALLPSGEVAWADADRQNGLTTADLDYVVQAALGQVGLVADENLLRFFANQSTLPEGGTGFVDIELSSYAPGQSVAYTVLTNPPGAGTATAGQDFAPFGGTAPIQGNRARIPVTLLDDSVREGYETIVLQLTGLAGYQTIIPTRHTILIEDNDHLWRGALQEGENPFPSFTSFDVEILKNGNVVTGQLLGATTPGTSDGIFPAVSINVTDTVFQIAFAGLPAQALSEQLDDFPVTRNFVLDASGALPGQSVNDRFVEGTYAEAIIVQGADYLTTVRQGRFNLNRAVEYPPLVEPEVQTIP